METSAASLAFFKVKAGFTHVDLCVQFTEAFKLGKQG
jgi:hypothetical protein